MIVVAKGCVDQVRIRDLLTYQPNDRYRTLQC